MSMFNRATNVAVHGGSFVNVVNERGPPSLDKLMAEVAPNAILNAGGRADEVRCFPGTREEVIGKLEKFMDDDTPGKKRIMWLSGPAGAGKSAICQTVAERRSKQKKQAVNFFFFRGDSTRGHPKPLVPTLVYQLRAFHPTLDSILSDYFEKDPLICNSSIQNQFEQLIACPFQTIQHPAPIQHQIILIIDGLDECNNDEREQDQILVALHTLAHADNSPFLILISSRAEPQLVRSFNRLGSSTESIFLDDDYRPQKDIRRFVVAKFADIKKDHHLGKTLGEKWPTRADIDAITDKSSGHFIYGATIMRFIEHSPQSPALSLVAILEMQPFIDHNPLAHLDAVYSYIFSKAHNLRAVRLVLFARNCFPAIFGEMLQLAGYTAIHVESFFGDLAAIIKVNTGTSNSSPELEFYHASLEDYLTDKSRSQIYYVRENEIAAEFASICLRNICKADSIRYTLQALGQVQKPTPELTQSFFHASTKYLNGERQVVYLDNLIACIEQLYWEHDKDQFKVLLQHWSRFVRLNDLDRLSCRRIKPKNPEASQYYKQYWMSKWDSEQEPPMLPGSTSDVLAPGNIPAKVSPIASIGSPVPNLTACKPRVSSGNDSYNNDRTATETETAGEWRTGAGLGCLHFLSLFHGLFDLLRCKDMRSPSRTGYSIIREDEEEHESREYTDGSSRLSVIRVKLYYQEDIRSTMLTPNAPFSEFVDKVTAKFGKSINDLTLTFKDEDGDKIILRDNYEYEHAIETARQRSKGKAETKLEIWCQDSAR